MNHGNADYYHPLVDMISKPIRIGQTIKKHTHINKGNNLFKIVPTKERFL